MFSQVHLPPRSVAFPWIRALKKNQSAFVKVWASTPIWIVDHWDSQHLSRCFAVRKPNGEVIDFHGCACEKEQWELRYAGYLFCYHLEAKRPEWLKITRGMWEHIEEAVPGGEDLRGFRIRATRGQSNNARVELKITRALPEEYGERFPVVPDLNASLKAYSKIQ